MEDLNRTEETEQGGKAEPIEFEESEILMRLKNSLRGVEFKVALMGAEKGLGVSTMTANLALALAQPVAEEMEDPRGEPPRIGVLDLDVIDGPSIPGMLGFEDPVARAEGETIIPAVGSAGIKVVSADLLLGSSFILQGAGKNDWSVLENPLSRVGWGRLDILLIDLPAGIDEAPDPLGLLPLLDASIIVTLPVEEAREHVRRLWKFSDSLSIPPIGLVCNMAGKHGGVGAEELGRQFGIPVCADIPFEPELPDTGMGGAYGTLKEGGEKVKIAFFRFVEELIEYLYWLHDEHDDEEVF